MDFYAPVPRLPDETSAGTLNARLEWARPLVDGGLSRAARWKGALRRERIRGEANLVLRTRFAETFDHLASIATTTEAPGLGIALLHSVHEGALGGSVYRDRGVLVGLHRRFPATHRIGGLVEGLFNRLAHSGAPASLLAAHAHLELVQIHPFPDGNGRTARLVAAYILMRSGFRSTLFTSVEQHCVSDPLAYLQVLRAYSRRRITFEECAVALLRFNVASAWFAAWFKARRARWHRHCDALGVPFEERQGLSEGFEDGKGSNELCSRVSPEILPLRTVIPQLSPAGRAALAHQVGRLASEEGEASRDMVSQRPLSATLPELAPAAARGAFSQTRLKRMTPFGG